MSVTPDTVRPGSPLWQLARKTNAYFAAKPPDNTTFAAVWLFAASNQKMKSIRHLDPIDKQPSAGLGNVRNHAVARQCVRVRLKFSDSIDCATLVPSPICKHFCFHS